MIGPFKSLNSCLTASTSPSQLLEACTGPSGDLVPMNAVNLATAIYRRAAHTLIA